MLDHGGRWWARREVKAGKSAPVGFVLVEHDGQQEFLESSMVVWASGVTAHGTVKEWGVPQGRGGRIETDEHLRVKGVDDVYAIGDV